MNRPAARGAPWRPSTTLVLVACLVAAAALALVIRGAIRTQRNDALATWRERLSETAAERAVLVGAWVTENTRDGQTVASFPSVGEFLSPRPAGAAAARARETVRQHLHDLLSNYVGSNHFAYVEILDDTGRVALRAGNVTPADESPQLFEHIAATHTPVAEVYAAPLGNRVVFGVPCLSEPEGRLLGAILLVADADEWLYPELLREPVPTRTGENLLIGRVGTRSVVLSPFRHPMPPVTADGPFPDAGLSAEAFPQAARLDSYRDYRGVQVVAMMQPVPGTRWAILSKVDRDEVLAPADRRALQMAATWAALGLAALALLYAFWRQRQASYASEQLASADRIGFLNRLLRTISEVHALIIRERDRQRLLDGTCRIIVEDGGFQLAWIGQPDAGHRVRVVASAGRVGGDLELLDVRSDDSPAGRGPTGTAIRERRAVAVEDVAAAPEATGFREIALARGLRSTGAFPLVCDERVVGALTVHASEAGVLRDEAVDLLASLALDVAYAIQVLENDAEHRATVQERARLQEQLLQAQKMEAVGRLAGGVAHDFNNILTAITGYAELALVETGDAERCRRDIEEIRRAGERAGALTRQLLAFSRKQVLQPRVVDLNAVVRDVEKLLRRMIGEDIRFGLSLAPSAGRVKADPGQLEQVLMNLAVNARDAMPSGGQVLIETGTVQVTEGDPRRWPGLEPGRYVSLAFRDSGVGIPPEALPHIFDPFFTTKEHGKGTGLGLATVYGIVRQSGGAIAVDSEPGRGAVFTICLPQVEEAAAPAAVADVEAPAVNGRGEAVLVVEDNDGVRHLAEKALTRAGFVVATASSAEQALAVLEQHGRPIDLLLTDVVLPRMTGPELAAQVSTRYPRLKVLYMSGYTEADILPPTVDLDRDLVAKPFTPAVIAARVGRALRDP